LHFNRIIAFQIGIFIYSDIYCSQASRSYTWRVLCKNQVNWTGSCATVQTGLWRRSDASQYPTDKHWRCPDVIATPFGRSVNQYSTRSLFSEIDIDWKVSVFRPDDVHYLQAVGRLGNTSRRYTVIQITPGFQWRPSGRSVKPSGRTPDKDNICAIFEGYHRKPSGRGKLPSRRSTVRVCFSSNLRSLEAYK